MSLEHQLQNKRFPFLLQEWTRATHIRLRLLKVKTLLADLLPLARKDPSVTRRVCLIILTLVYNLHTSV